MPTTENRCLHELLPDQCIICKPRVAAYWDAQYHSTCPTCGRSINPGDRVRWTADGLHAEHARHGKV